MFNYQVAAIMFFYVLLGMRSCRIQGRKKFESQKKATGLERKRKEAVSKRQEDGGFKLGTLEEREALCKREKEGSSQLAEQVSNLIGLEKKGM